MTEKKKAESAAPKEPYRKGSWRGQSGYLICNTCHFGTRDPAVIERHIVNAHKTAT